MGFQTVWVQMEEGNLTKGGYSKGIGTSDCPTGFEPAKNQVFCQIRRLVKTSESGN